MTKELGAHDLATMALVSTAKSSLAALREAVAALPETPGAARDVAEQATLLSKAADSLSKKIDDLPDDYQAKPPADAGPRLHIEQVTDLLSRTRRLASAQACLDCGGVLANE